MNDQEQNEADGELVAKVARFQQAARYWATMDPQQLRAMLSDPARPCWMFRKSSQEHLQVMLVMVTVEDSGKLIQAMLDTLQDPPRSQVMQGILDWLQRLAVVRLEGMPEKDRQEALATAERAAQATIESIRGLRVSGSRLQ